MPQAFEHRKGVLKEERRKGSVNRGNSVIARRQKCYDPSGSLCGRDDGTHLKKFLKSYIFVLIVENVIFFSPKVREIQEWQCYLGIIKCRKEGFV